MSTPKSAQLAAEEIKKRFGGLGVLEEIAAIISKHTQGRPRLSPSRDKKENKVSAPTDTQMMDWVEKHRAYIGRNGYRGSFGLVVYVADPGGHYQEERVKHLGFGGSMREAIADAMEKHP